MSGTATFKQLDPWVKFRNGNHVMRTSHWIGREELELATRQDVDGDTLLHIAVAKGNEVACRRLIATLVREKVSLDIKNHILQTPLHIACIVDHPAIACMLLEASPSSCDVADRHGNNCVHLAIKHSKSVTQHRTLEAVIKLASLKTLEKKNLDGYTPMHLAAIEGKCKGIQLLKKAGASVNSLDNKGGATPLILATRSSQSEAAQALLEGFGSDLAKASRITHHILQLGANPSFRTTYGETASQLASAKADHVISELLALYDSPCDSSKAALSRYINENPSASTRIISKQNLTTTRLRETKMKPFINVRHMQAPVPSAVRIPLYVSPPQPPFRVKSERRSPVTGFPSLQKQNSVVENASQPLNYVVRHRESDQQSGSPAQKPGSRRKLDEDDSPLDLSVKKAKTSFSQALPASSFAAPSNTVTTSDFVFVHPAYPLTADRLSKATSHIYYSLNQLPVATVAASVRRNSAELVRSPKLVTVPHSESHLGKIAQRISAKLASDNKHSAQQSQEKSREIHSAKEEKPQRSADGKTTGIQIPKQTGKMEANYGDRITSNNGFFHPRSYDEATLLKLQDHIAAKHLTKFYDPRFYQPITRAVFETFEKVQPTTKHIEEMRDMVHPISSRQTASHDYHRTLKQQSSVESLNLLSAAYLPPTSTSQQLTVPGKALSNGRERRYQSDGSYYDINRPIDKQFIIRRNSAPVPVKANSDKIDLRSYTGCLPPHYLHLLESSGNLPIRASNALRNVTDVLRNNVKSTDVKSNNVKRESTDKKNSPENLRNAPFPSPINAIQLSSMLVSTKKSSSQSARERQLATSAAVKSVSESTSQATPSPQATPSFSITNSNIPIASCSQIVTTSLSTSTITSTFRPFYFEKLGDWTDIEKGDFPAFGRPSVIPAEKIKDPPHPIKAQEYSINEKYISENTRKILQNASTLPVKSQSFSSTQIASYAGEKHFCCGCSKKRKDIPPLIADIWRFHPIAKYAAPSSSASVVYCWQLNSKLHDTSPTSVTQNRDVTNFKPNMIISEPEDLFTVNKKQGEATNRLTAKASQPQHRVVLRQQSGTENQGKVTKGRQSVTDFRRSLSLNQARTNSLERDDMTTNCIEASDDDEMDLKAVVKAATRERMHPQKNGFHDKLSEIIQNTLLKNLERHSEVVQKLRSVQSILSKDFKEKDSSKDAYKDYHISDLEISDDDETPAEKKSV